jgi:hypothetical protein
MPTDDSEMRNALNEYNDRLAKSRNRIRLFAALVIWPAAVLSCVLSVLAAFAVFKDPAVAADLDSGTHTRDVAWAGRAAALFALLGVALISVGIWRGPTRTRWAGFGMLLLGGVPLLGMSYFAFALAQ